MAEGAPGSTYSDIYMRYNLAEPRVSVMKLWDLTQKEKYVSDNNVQLGSDIKSQCTGEFSI